MKLEQNLVIKGLGIILLLLLLTFVLRGPREAGVGQLQITGVVSAFGQGANFIILTITNRSDGTFAILNDNQGPRISAWVDLDNISKDISTDNGRAGWRLVHPQSMIVFTNRVPHGVGNVRYELTAYKISRIWLWLQKINEVFESRIIDSASKYFRIDGNKPISVFSDRIILDNQLRDDSSSAGRVP